MSTPKRIWATLFLTALFCLSTAGTVRADLQAFVGRDVIELKDGSRIQCLILMESSRGVLIIMPDPEKGEDAYRQRFIPVSQIKKVVRGVRQGETKAFQTDTELARKVIQGSGYRPAQEVQTQPAKPIEPTGHIAPAKPPVTAQPAPEPVRAPGEGALPAKELAEAYLQRFPALETAAEHLLGGQTQLATSLEAALTDPAARQETERLLDLFLQNTETETPKSTRTDPKRVKPAPRTTKRPPVTTRK